MRNESEPDQAAGSTGSSTGSYADEQVTAGDPSAREQVNTTDVRDAIERARTATAEGLQAEAAQSSPQSEPQPEQESATTIFPETDRVALPVSTPSAAAEPVVPLPSAAPSTESEPFAAANAAADTAAPQPQQYTIDPEHPMAALYIQQPMPPTPQGNRGAGVLIGLLATLGFAVVYAGLIALLRAPFFPPSRFLEDGLLPYLTSWGFILPVAAFFVALALLVLIVNRAGWWAYVLGGVLIAAVVWAAAGVGYVLSPQLGEEGARNSDAYQLGIDQVIEMVKTLPALAAGIAAREVTVWFGAWIGARGRRMKVKNAAALEEYEAKLAEVQAKLA